MSVREILCTPEKYAKCQKKDQCTIPKCPNPECGKPLSQPQGKDKKIANSICWHCGTAFYDPEDGMD